MEIPKLYPLKEIAEKTGFCVAWLQTLCRSGKISHVRRGRRFFFTDEDVARLLVHVEGGAGK